MEEKKREKEETEIKEKKENEQMMMMMMKNKRKKKKIHGASDSRKKTPFQENQLSGDSSLELLRCRWLHYGLICFYFTRQKICTHT